MTDSFFYFFPASFPALALAHFLALVSPGPDFFLIVGHGIRHRFRGAVFICIGIALGNAIYISLAIAGWSGLKQQPFLYRILELSGSVYLIWMGVMLWKASRHPISLEEKKGKTLNPWQQIAAGLGSSLLNPKNMIFYLTLMTVIIGPEASLSQQIASGIWMASVVLMWDVLLVASLSYQKAQNFLKDHIPLIEKTAGCLLIAIASGIILKPLFPN